MSEYSKLLKNKLSFITGCNRGIGKAILNVLSENCTTIWACVRIQDDNFDDYITRLEQKTGAVINQIFFDLSNIDQIKEGAKKIMLHKKPVDILINNAGIVYNALFQMTAIKK